MRLSFRSLMKIIVSVLSVSNGECRFPRRFPLLFEADGAGVGLSSRWLCCLLACHADSPFAYSWIEAATTRCPLPVPTILTRPSLAYFTTVLVSFKPNISAASERDKNSLPIPLSLPILTTRSTKPLLPHAPHIGITAAFRAWRVVWAAGATSTRPQIHAPRGALHGNVGHNRTDGVRWAGFMRLANGVKRRAGEDVQTAIGAICRLVAGPMFAVGATVLFHGATSNNPRCIGRALSFNQSTSVRVLPFSACALRSTVCQWDSRSS